MRNNRAKEGIYLTDVVKMTQPKAFATLLKPVGSACNMDCLYCYYKDKAQLYGSHQPLMSDVLLEQYIKDYLSSVEQPVVTFCWHGGEPLLAGLDFYRKAVEWQKRYCGEKKVENSLQTNGLLLSEEWCDFFRENRFLVGLSLDGPQEIHDAYRLDRAGNPTFERVMRGLEKLASHKVDYNILSTVNLCSEGHGAEVYRFLRSLSPFLQFLPVVEHLCVDERAHRVVSPEEDLSASAPWSVTAEGYGQFMCDVFDEWMKEDVGRVFVQLFDVTLSSWCGLPSSLCAFCETCGDGLAVEHNGDVYSCDHFVYPEYLLGNIKERSLGEMYRSTSQRRFGMDKRDNLPLSCRRCAYYFLCHGECPKHRFEYTDRGEPYLNSLCQGYKMFFRHTDPYMRQMKSLLAQNLAPSLVMDWARERKVKEKI